MRILRFWGGAFLDFEGRPTSESPTPTRILTVYRYAINVLVAPLHEAMARLALGEETGDRLKNARWRVGLSTDALMAVTCRIARSSRLASVQQKL